MNVQRILLLILCLFTVFSGGLTFAKSQYVGRLPNGDVFGCENCHSPTTPFYTDFKNNGHLWNAALAQQDSDGDGYTNGAELQDPSGAWQQGQAAPGDRGLVTNPGSASSFPQPTPTPTEPPTATPTLPPTPTPAGELAIGLVINQTAFHAGDVFDLRKTITNPGAAFDANEFVLLEFGGQFWFWPAWTQTFQFNARAIPASANLDEPLLAFTWPAVSGGFSARFWYALLDPGNTTLLTGHDMIDWTYGM